jgi:hypothetical protein
MTTFFAFIFFCLCGWPLAKWQKNGYKLLQKQNPSVDVKPISNLKKWLVLCPLCNEPNGYYR